MFDSLSSYQGQVFNNLYFTKLILVCQYFFVIFIFTERVGFEPTHVLPPNGFQDRPLKPLGYRSLKDNFLVK